MNQNQDNEHSITAKSFLMVLSESSLLSLSQPRATLICFLALEINEHFLEFYINSIRQHVVFFVGLPSCSIVLLGFIMEPLCKRTEAWPPSTVHSSVSCKCSLFPGSCGPLFPRCGRLQGEATPGHAGQALSALEGLLLLA